METVTDKNGEFNIPGKGVSVNLDFSVFIFKAGYEYIIRGPWEALKEDKILRTRIKWEGNRAIIPLKKLTMEERKRRHVDKENIPDDKQRLLIQELNKEYKELNIPPYTEETQ